MTQAPFPMLPVVAEVERVDTAALPEQDARAIAEGLAVLEATVAKSRGCYVLTIPAHRAFGGVETQVIGRHGEPLLAVVTQAVARNAGRPR